MQRVCLSIILLSVLCFGPFAFAQIFTEPPLGLGDMPVPASNPSSDAKVELGRTLFFDKKLSADGTVSCVSCHDPEQAFAQAGVAISKGVGERLGRRNAPSLFNVGYASSLFYDGRSETLEHQAWAPLLAADEMANPSADAVIERLRASTNYPALFDAAFGKDQISSIRSNHVAEALAAFQRTLVSGDSKFDQWNWGKAEFDEIEQLGHDLFSGQAQCWQCHILRGETLLFSDQKFHNTGVLERNKILRRSPKEAKQSVPDATPDLGRFEVTGEPQDRGAFKTPSLRNVDQTAPYMHDGSIPTLREVVEFYNEGFGPDVQALDLSEEEIKALVVFLKLLSSESSASSADHRTRTRRPSGQLK